MTHKQKSLRIDKTSFFLIKQLQNDHWRKPLRVKKTSFSQCREREREKKVDKTKWWKFVSKKTPSVSIVCRKIHVQTSFSIKWWNFVSKKWQAGSCCHRGFYWNVEAVPEKHFDWIDIRQLSIEGTCILHIFVTS